MEVENIGERRTEKKWRGKRSRQKGIKYDKMLFVDPKELRLKSSFGLFPTENPNPSYLLYSKRVNLGTIGGMALVLSLFKTQLKKERILALFCV